MHKFSHRCSRVRSPLSLRTSAHAGVAIRFPFAQADFTEILKKLTFRGTDCHVAALLAMTVVDGTLAHKSKCIPCLLKPITTIVIYRTTQSLPCVKGGGPPNGGSEGLCSTCFFLRIGFRRIRKTFPHNPSVKNQRFLTAPFTQGSLGRSRASMINYNFRRNDTERCPGV